MYESVFVVVICACVFVYVWFVLGCVRTWVSHLRMHMCTNGCMCISRVRMYVHEYGRGGEGRGGSLRLIDQGYFVS